MIIVHHLENSRSQRVLWLLEELGVEYGIVNYRRDPQTMLAPPELRTVHPLGKSPVITDEGVTVAETGAIVEYLVGRYDNGALAPPVGSEDRRRWTYWLHYAEGSAMPPLLLSLVMSRIARSPMPFFAKPIAKGIAAKVMSGFVDPQLRSHLDFLEGELASRPWFAGDAFSAADIQMSFPVEAFAARGGLNTSRPNVWGWLERIHARPAYRRAIEKGGPYELMR
jgi:glutathione S-transferase